VLETKEEGTQEKTRRTSTNKIDLVQSKCLWILIHVHGKKNTIIKIKT